MSIFRKKLLPTWTICQKTLRSWNSGNRWMPRTLIRLTKTVVLKLIHTCITVPLMSHKNKWTFTWQQIDMYFSNVLSGGQKLSVKRRNVNITGFKKVDNMTKSAISFPLTFSFQTCWLCQTRPSQGVEWQNLLLNWSFQGGAPYLPGRKEGQGRVGTISIWLKEQPPVKTLPSIVLRTWIRNHRASWIFTPKIKQNIFLFTLPLQEGQISS